LVAVAAITIVAYIVINSGSSSGPTSSKNKVLLTTSMGNITIQLRDDMPITTGNFKNLVQQGKYDGTTFHRIIANFMIQGGQINSTTSSIRDEFGSNNHNVNGTIAMAKQGDPTTGASIPDSASSQFFINVVDNSNRYATFDTTYSVFGDVIQGMDVADAISKVATDQNGNPLQSVTLIKAELID
jgi:peptidylprolyl isomerase